LGLDFKKCENGPGARVGPWNRRTGLTDQKWPTSFFTVQVQVNNIIINNNLVKVEICVYLKLPEADGG